MTTKELKLAKLNGTLEAIYGQMVDMCIRKKYTASEEFAILRQRDEKPEDWATYNAYCEECKAEVKKMFESI